ncbi:hypothetical protein A3709_00505 [Halioglobus sp. HI00S01]|uniref:acyl-CoA thioesterase n=1 Tax=Halioglobus sp. HI00S01 TaxID=1822214 RepID=UPI0007C2A10C|nr:thioesterase family protein [Halioglobus sp. HI00S01]KZX60585.1 hypothetical protein A3709_00505 [Halioglobus sp. HI00S01]
MGIPVTRITPRFNETDALGHINNAVMSVWFEVARTDALSYLRDGPRSEGRWLVASVTLDYLRETFYGSDVTINMSRVFAGNTSLTMECEMHQNNELVVKGKAVLVHVDMESKAKLRVPDVMREKLATL